MGCPLSFICALLLLANLEVKDESDQIVKDVKCEDKQWNE